MEQGKGTADHLMPWGYLFLILFFPLFSPPPIGDPDDSIFVVQDGSMEIFIQKDNRDILAKVVQPGESVTSLLSILDVLTDNQGPFKTVSGRATRDSTILRLPGKTCRPLIMKVSL